MSGEICWCFVSGVIWGKEIDSSSTLKHSTSEQDSAEACQVYHKLLRGWCLSGFGPEYSSDT
jgi:hypothetical protein